MAEIAEILESEEMAEVMRAVEALKQRFGAHPGSIPFQRNDGQHLWPIALTRVGRYKPDVVLKILLDDHEYYPGYKAILAAGFGGWLIAPRSKEVREALVVHAAVAHMDRAESLASIDTSFTVQKDIAARYLFTGTDFLVEVYDCLGGHRAFGEAPSFDELWDAFESVEKTINTASRAITYLHHATDRFGSPGSRFVPSLNKAVSVLDELKNAKKSDPSAQQYVSRSLLHQRWSQNKQTLALLYSASTIRINRRTLLQIILDGFFSYEDHRSYLETWVGRARYVATHIFARMKGDLELERKTHRILGEGKITPFSPPKLDDAELASFKRTFRNFING
ncbi:hypothetical protein [Rhizobium leguminosarum]|uniref:Uncharacterized protein n=1 Tax=Rhizobium leguminosarum TaxID=384 RepID=A0A1B1CF15_RHILE|nr:hypothetical protein [Rhizobium leguminosarum]ANP88276.1 hypothetical protein BA011_22755 [Rhizobium leguminosarum]